MFPSASKLNSLQELYEQEGDPHVPYGLLGNRKSGKHWRFLNHVYLGSDEDRFCWDNGAFRSEAAQIRIFNLHPPTPARCRSATLLRRPSQLLAHTADKPDHIFREPVGAQPPLVHCAEILPRGSDSRCICQHLFDFAYVVKEQGIAGAKVLNQGWVAVYD